MFKFFSLKNKEIPEELKVIVDVPCTVTNEYDSNKFLLVEQNGIPVHVPIQMQDLNYANDKSKNIFFSKIEENLFGRAELIKNYVEKRSKISELIENGIETIYKYFSFTNLKDALGMSNSELGFNELNKVEIRLREIKYLTTNSNGSLTALVNKSNLLIIINLNDNSKIN
jgi:hypothetical protein